MAWIRRLVLALLLAAPLSLAGGQLILAAPNDGCVVSSGTAECPDVPTDGIDYSSGVDTVHTDDGTPGTTIVTPGTIGISLTQSGVNSSDTGTSTTYKVITYDIDPGSGTDNRKVLADDDDNPIKVGTDYIFSNNAEDSFTIGSDATTYTKTTLAQHLQDIAVSGGGSADGSLTVTNDGAAFTTSNAAGIRVQSVGGTGGNGGCTTILLATWCDDGGSGGNAGSVAVNNDGTIVVTGGYGVSATSIGGTGGNGGGSFGLFASDAGSGGNGGNGADVTVNLLSNSDISTTGDGAHGVYAVSNGGNGGSGGSPSSLVALGDSGGSGGSAGVVTVTNAGSITTNGARAHGIYAESMGAGAGHGSDSGGLVALGGNGGGESSGNKVTVNNSGNIETFGTDSFGILAQSIGGGGGDGGRSGGLFTVGGDGGSGGGSDTVTVNNSGTVVTHERGSVGVFAQSVGGGGGNGGNAYSGGPGIAVAVGGDGGLGGNGGVVIINELSGELADLAAASITTGGDLAHGIQAQSVGGGGGNGGLAIAGSLSPSFLSASVALGGNGDHGGAAAAVTVNEKGHITTVGDVANGIFAQSVGGGGGSGGGSVSASASGGYSLGLAIGGGAGEGSNGGVVAVNAMGGIDTTGESSHGILAQSVGGGGGNGGYAVSVTGGAMAGSVALGGTGSGGGDGSTVTVNVYTIPAAGLVAADDTIHTRGNGSHGIFAQSVGGGGGSGGFSAAGALGGGAISVGVGGKGAGGGIGGTVGVLNYDKIITDGAGSYGILGQSIGGGGGNGGFSLGLGAGVLTAAVAVGGNGGGGNSGGAVTVDNHGNITTHGDLSYGVLAQSIGGGGGNGGSSIAATIAISIPDTVPAGSFAVAIGGDGGAGSNGGHVILNNDGNITTGTKVVESDGDIVRTGNSAHALFAQSVGGGGGNGGYAGAGALSLGDGMSFALAIGGTGGDGGVGGIVDLTNRGTNVATWGDGADGIHAQSIGGGGGDGGFGLSLAASGGGEVNLSVAVALGGGGGDGGYSQAVTVNNYGGITTDGNKSNGIFAQSVGGGGGTGGFAASGVATISETAGQVGVSVGGGGGDGNYSGTVTVNNYGAITTYGTESLGIFAQSVGGGGGNGGMSVVGQFNFGSENSAQAGVSVGGGGGDGNYAAAVSVSNLVNPDTLLPGAITTYGFGSHGILAQSVGGGGGKGGMSIYGGMSIGGTQTTANVGVSVGGLGGDGGYGDTVTVINDGAIRVVGDNAMGIVAQSVGGGGGDGGNSIMAMMGITNVVEEDAATFNVGVSVGGFGGDGNYAGAVNVTNTGTIITGSTDEAGKVASGLGGNGIFAQSVGGGGGVGGRSNTINIVAGPKCSLPFVCQAPANQGNNIALTASVGGNGGTGGDGGIVTVVNKGQIVTVGDTANGIFAQSIGGGGGTGGNGILGTGELLPVPVELAFIPVGQTAIYKDISVAVGGNGGATGDGKLVDVDNYKNITTKGDYANGIFAQSVGGGGGVGGNAVIGATGKVGVGGKGNAGGDGGVVKVSNLDNAVIETFGIASDGIFAQSVGGGGGIAGNVDRALAAGLDVPLIGHIPVNLGIGLAFGQGGGAGGDGGEVQVDGTGSIFTHGDGSHGIFAQSVGGGGGVQGGLGNELPVVDLLSWHVGSNGDTGSAGKVTVDMDGMIATAGNGAHGIFAQSSGGASGTGGDVNISVDGKVLTAAIFVGDEGAPLSGYGSVGIMAQSAGWGGNGNVNVTLEDADTVVSGGRSGDVVVDNSDPLNPKIAHYQGVGVFVVDGNNNTVTNHGTITTVGGVDSGWAIYATGSDPTNADLTKRQVGGYEVVTNYGTVTGSIDLGAGVNSFGNEVGAKFNMGGIVNLGAGNDLINDGWMSSGGNARVMTTKATADVVQNVGATYGVDLDLSKTEVAGEDGTTGEADLLDVTGDLAMSGGVDLTILNAGYATTGQHSVIIARSSGAFDASTVTLTAPASLVATYELTTAEKELILGYSIDFDIDGLNDNQSAIGDYINDVQLAGGSTGLAPLVAALFGISDLDQYKDLLDQLSPEPYVINETLDMLASLNFENSLMSCKVQDGVNKFDAEGQCAWASLGSRRYERDETDSNLGFDQSTLGLSAGAQARVTDNVFAGIGGSWEDLQTTGSDQSSSDGQRVQGGVVLKGVWDNTTLALALTGGMSSQDVTRTVSLPLGPIYTLEGTQDISFASLHARLGHSFGGDDWYVRPMIDLGITQVSTADFSETGGPMALDVEGHDETYITVSPSIEIGGETDLGEDAVVRGFARFGLLGVPSGSDPTITAGFADAPDGVDPFTITGDIDELLYDLTVGIDVIADNGMVVRLNGDTKIGETINAYGGSIKLSAPF